MPSPSSCPVSRARWSASISATPRARWPTTCSSPPAANRRARQPGPVRLNSAPMPVLATRVDPSSSAFQANRTGMLERLQELDRLLAQARAGGGAKYVERHRARGKLLARERVELLIDRDSPL